MNPDLIRVNRYLQRFFFDSLDGMLLYYCRYAEHVWKVFSCYWQIHPENCFPDWHISLSLWWCFDCRVESCFSGFILLEMFSLSDHYIQAALTGCVFSNWTRVFMKLGKWKRTSFFTHLKYVYFLWHCSSCSFLMFISGIASTFYLFITPLICSLILSFSEFSTSFSVSQVCHYTLAWLSGFSSNHNTLCDY